MRPHSWWMQRLSFVYIAMAVSVICGAADAVLDSHEALVEAAEQQALSASKTSQEASYPLAAHAVALVLGSPPPANDPNPVGMDRQSSLARGAPPVPPWAHGR
mmetsp:Transcript_50573/g.84054  ORF Transcript_50573/g.84054 Transcript_50573/m.84054 type:complete len:103 (+) Transcript_50573:39-347(+)